MSRLYLNVVCKTDNKTIIAAAKAMHSGGSMIVEIISNLLALNFGYFADIFTGGIFWVFAFSAAGYYFGNGKKILLNFIVITGLLLTFADLLHAHDLLFYTAPALLVLYLARITVLTYLEKSGLGRNLPLAFSLTTYAVLFYYNFFMI